MGFEGLQGIPSCLQGSLKAQHGHPCRITKRGWAMGRRRHPQPPGVGECQPAWLGIT